MKISQEARKSSLHNCDATVWRRRSGDCGCGGCVGCDSSLAVVLAVMIGLCPKASSARKTANYSLKRARPRGAEVLKNTVYHACASQASSALATLAFAHPACKQNKIGQSSRTRSSTCCWAHQFSARTSRIASHAISQVAQVAGIVNDGNLMVKGARTCEQMGLHATR